MDTSEGKFLSLLRHVSACLLDRSVGLSLNCEGAVPGEVLAVGTLMTEL